MKFFTLVMFLMGSFANAGVSITDDQKYELNNAMGGIARKNELGKLVDEKTRTLKVVYDPSIGTVGSIGVNSLGVTIPAGAYITNSYLKIVSGLGKFDPSGSSTISFKCAADQDIRWPQNLGAVFTRGFLAGQSVVGHPSTYKIISSDCEVSAVVGGSNFTYGEVLIFIDYVLGE